MISSLDIITIFDFIGVIACSIAATILALRTRFDFLGCILVSMVNAIGGGTIRDVFLDRHPLFWTTELSYVYVITITSIITQFAINHYQTINKKIDWLIRFFDAIGLAAFSVIGLKVALAYQMHPLIATLMAVLTSIAGGIMRDMICNQIPLVLQKEIYLSTCIIGSLVYFGLGKLGFDSSFQELIMLAVVFCVRMLALKYNWNLPPLHLKGFKSKI